MKLKGIKVVGDEANEDGTFDQKLTFKSNKTTLEYTVSSPIGLWLLNRKYDIPMPNANTLVPETVQEDMDQFLDVDPTSPTQVRKKSSRAKKTTTAVNDESENNGDE